MSGTTNDERSLSFYHTHTGKALSVVYFKNGRYVPTALDAIDDFLRDFRNGDEHRMDPALLDVLFDIKLKTGTHAPFQVISAYRSPETNQMLRDTTRRRRERQHASARTGDRRATRRRAARHGCAAWRSTCRKVGSVSIRNRNSSTSIPGAFAGGERASVDSVGNARSQRPCWAAVSSAVRSVPGGPFRARSPPRSCRRDAGATGRRQPRATRRSHRCSRSRPLPSMACSRVSA